MLQHEARSGMWSDISTELTEAHANCSSNSGKEFCKKHYWKPSEEGRHQLAVLSPKYQKVVAPVNKKITWHFPLSYKNRSLLIIRFHRSVYLEGEKALHFSFCKYVREEVNIFPALTTLQLCLSKSKHVAFFPKENLESYLISTSPRLCLYGCAFKQAILSSRWSWDQGSQIHIYPLQLSSSFWRPPHCCLSNSGFDVYYPSIPTSSPTKEPSRLRTARSHPKKCWNRG